MILLSSDGLEPLLTTLATCICGVLLFAVIARAIFSVNKFLKNSKIQTDILIKIAEKSGVTADEISAIVNKAS